MMVGICAVSGNCRPPKSPGDNRHRAEDGLALSSRNGYLSVEERAEAPLLYKVLNDVANEVRGGQHNVALVEQLAMERLAGRGWKPDYVAVRKRIDLQPPSAADMEQGAPLVVLSAAKLGATRLIDNLAVDEIE